MTLQQFCHWRREMKRGTRINTWMDREVLIRLSFVTSSIQILIQIHRRFF